METVVSSCFHTVCSVSKYTNHHHKSNKAYSKEKLQSAPFKWNLEPSELVKKLFVEIAKIYSKNKSIHEIVK